MLGLSHPAAESLARRLVEIAPGGLTRVFYSDSGSTAVEVALKMAFQYWQQAADRRPSRTSFVCLENAYHGDTMGSVSVGGIDLFHSMYEPLLFDSHRVPAGDSAALESILDARAGEIAAVVLEPLVQGAAGMLIQPPGYLRAVRDLCDRHDVFLICDEVATGFGRTGTMFACEQEAVAPDLLCLAKGLTGGYMPLAATLATDRIHSGFLGEYDEFRTFFHGHTYTGNPLACAAALATLDVFEEERTLELLVQKTALLQQLLHDLVEPLAHVAEVRQIGFMCGIELADRDGRPHDPALRMGHRVTLAARARGAIVRPLGEVVVLMPPLSITPDALEELVEITADAIVDATSASGELRAAA
jgi:adenosylmethionine---8-amino-7-oxononanoate aminotransferase